MPSSADEIRDWLRLMNTAGVGPEFARKLLATFGLPAQIFAQSARTLATVVPPRLAAALLARPDQPFEALAARTAAWAAEPGNHFLTLADPDYPPALLDLADPPPVLYAKGQLARLSRPGVAIVGSRHATPQGLANAEAFARTLGGAGLTIASGLALGIDAAAHTGALGTAGSTAAAVGTGLDIVYPGRHRTLAARIAADGVLLSEFPLGTPALSHHFPRRNRLIAALCRGTLVVEAAAQSGSLITARLAAELGREVFAMPGSIHSPLAKGCHQLLKQGAKLVETAQDIFEELRWAAGEAPCAPPARLMPLRPSLARPGHDGPASDDTLLRALGYDPVSVDQLCEQTGVPAAQMQRRLLALELEGAVTRLPGGLYQRTTQI